MSKWPRPSAPHLFSCLDATWPAHDFRAVGPWTLRAGAGGGQRVSAATLSEGAVSVDADAIAAVERETRRFGQIPLFMVKHGQDALDRALEKRGYRVVDPVAVLAAPLDALAGAGQQAGEAIECSEPIAALEDLWADGGTGPARLAVMRRAKTAKTYLLGRYRDRPAAAAFVATFGGVAMLHSLVVEEAFRRRGIGQMMSMAAAAWARRQGASTLAVLAVRDNRAAIDLYLGMGMQECAAYHYRKQPE